MGRENPGWSMRHKNSILQRERGNYQLQKIPTVDSGSNHLERWLRIIRATSNYHVGLRHVNNTPSKQYHYTNSSTIIYMNNTNNMEKQLKIPNTMITTKFITASTLRRIASKAPDTHRRNASKAPVKHNVSKISLFSFYSNYLVIYLFLLSPRPPRVIMAAWKHISQGGMVMGREESGCEGVMEVFLADLAFPPVLYG